MTEAFSPRGSLLRDRIRLPMHCPVENLLAEVRALPETAWVDHFVPQHYEGSWRVLPLRGPAGETHPIRMATSNPCVEAFEDTPFLGMAARRLLARFRCPLLSTRIMALGPGSRILEHRDHDLDGADGVVRLHVPLATHPGVSFLLNGEPVPFQAGEVWCLRLSDPHAVVNEGPDPRLHLVVDARLDPWLRELLALPPEVAAMLAFVQRVGLDWELADLPAGTVLPGLDVTGRRILVDPGRLLHPGDVLHEAGHLAVLLPEEREVPAAPGLRDPGLEMASMAWSYAAAVHLGLPPELVFHDAGYRGEAGQILAAYRDGANLGQPLLAWMGLTSWQGHGPGEPFPAMAAWVRGGPTR